MKTSRYLAKPVALLCWMLGASAAMADQGIAYALIADGTAATVSAEYSLNPGGGAVTAIRISTGLYSVTFPNSGIGIGWSAQTAAYGNNSNYCNIALLWTGSGVLVQCYNSSGAVTDSPFTVLAVSNLNDKNIAFALANQPSTGNYVAPASYSYNPNGATSTIIIRSSVGTYQVDFGGLSPLGGTIQVTAAGGTASCYSGTWGGAGADLVANVSCADTGGNPVDSSFVIAVVPYGVSPTGLAYAFDNYPYPAFYGPGDHYDYSPVAVRGALSGEIDDTSTTGRYLITFNGLAAAQVNGGNVRATANGSAARCKVTRWQAGNVETGPPGSSLQVFVSCFNFSGALTDAKFTVLALPAMGYAYASITETGDVTLNSVNPGNAPVTASHGGTGSYTVTFPNSGIGHGWTALAFALQPPSYNCQASGWIGGTVYVSCFSSAGVAADTMFDVLAISNTNDQSIAFAWEDLPPSAGTYTITDYAYNPAGSITTTRFSAGSYSVIFNGLNGAGGTVQVAASGTREAHCVSNGWSGSNFTVAVRCYDHGGNPVDTPFSTAVIPGGATPSGIAFGQANKPTAHSYSAAFAYDSSGAEVSVTRSSTGQYAMSFPGLSSTQVYGGHARATANGNTTNRCAVLGWSTNVGSGMTVYVNCYDLAGVYTDTEFQVLLFVPVVGPPATVLEDGGSPQSALVNGQFALPLKALVIDGNGNPVPNVLVQFAVPISGASAYTIGGVVPTAVTDPVGVATSATFNSNGTPGSYSVTAVVVGVASQATFSLTNLPVTQVTLDTSPSGLQLSLDGAPNVTAPRTFMLAIGSSHIIATQGVQSSPGAAYYFQGWSDTITNFSDTVVVPATAITYTANFSTNYLLTIAASPVAGGTVTPAIGSFSPAGAVVPITATANPGYSFAGWTGNVLSASSPSTSVTMSAPETVTANFLPLTSITIQTSPSGRQFKVDNGALQTSPQTLNLTLGPHTLAVVTTQAGGTGIQYSFTGWNDSYPSASRSITVGGTPITYTAAFKTQYQLTTAALPGIGGSVSPPTGQFYDSGASVSVTATPTAPYAFSSWSGGAAGTSNPATVIMNGPQAVTANFAVPISPCQPTGGSGPSVADVQLLINESMGLAPPMHDLNGDGVVHIVDVQIEVNAILGRGCATR